MGELPNRIQESGAIAVYELPILNITRYTTTASMVFNSIKYCLTDEQLLKIPCQRQSDCILYT